MPIKEKEGREGCEGEAGGDSSDSDAAGRDKSSSRFKLARSRAAVLKPSNRRRSRST